MWTSSIVPDSDVSITTCSLARVCSFFALARSFKTSRNLINLYSSVFLKESIPNFAKKIAILLDDAARIPSGSSRHYSDTESIKMSTFFKLSGDSTSINNGTETGVSVVHHLLIRSAVHQLTLVSKPFSNLLLSSDS